jgi:hypothetical protein
MAAIGKSNQVLLERVRRVAGHKNPGRINRPKLLIFLLIAMTPYLSTSRHPQQKSSVPAVYNLLPRASSETRQLSFHNPVIVSDEKKTKNKNPKKPGGHIKPTQFKHEEPDETDLVLVANDETDKGPEMEKNDASLAIQPKEEKYYSISQDDENARPPLEETAAQFPFVPNSSFAYKLTVDTANQLKRRIYYDQKIASETNQKLKIAVEAIDWKKINTMLRQKGKKLTVKMLKDALYKSLPNPETQKVQAQTAEIFDEADEQRLRGDIKLELKALQNIKSKSPQEIQRLQQQLIREETNLHQQNLKKQRELLKNIEDEIRKKSKIVYI